MKGRTKLTFGSLITGGNKGMQRYRNRKQVATCPIAENRFSTQPVTLDEVQEAVKANQRATENPDGNDVATGMLMIIFYLT